MDVLLTHLFGIIGLLLIVMAWQSDDRVRILTFNATAFFFFSIELYLLGAMTGAAIMAFGSLRTLTGIYTQDKRVVAAFVVTAIAIGLSQYAHWYDALTIVAGIVGIMAFFSTDVKRMRLLAPIGTILWAVHNFHVGAWAQLTADFFILASMGVGYIRFSLNQPLKEAE